MKYNIYSVHDVKSGAFSRPWFVSTDEVAVGHFSRALNDPESDYSYNPADYTLFKIAEFDDNSAMIDEVEKVSLGNGMELKGNVETDN